MAAGRYIVLERPVDPLFIHDPSRVPGIDQGTLGNWSIAAHTTSDVLLGLTFAASMTVATLNQHGQDPFLPGAIIMETGLITTGVTILVKHAVARPRPYLYQPEVSLGERPLTDGMVSFWSGHTATAAAVGFSCANLVQRSDASTALKTVTWVAAATLPAAVGYYRVRSGRHFPTDVLTGYAFGALVGWAVPYFHRAEKKRRPLVE